MNILSYLLESRGLANALHRVPTLLGRFGISSGKMEKALHSYLALARDYGSTPTFPVTAVLLERYARVFRELRDQGAELAIHGYVHTDYSKLSLEQQQQHLEKAHALFFSLGLPVTGFRAPYLRWNNDSLKAASLLGLEYGSNGALFWDVVSEAQVRPAAWQAYEKGLQLYGARDANQFVSLPRLLNGLLDLPASLPDDEAIVDRLGLRGSGGADVVWPRILDQVYQRGELFTLILHHERVHLCRRSLEATLSGAKTYDPPVWVAPLGEIARWWTRRLGYELQLRWLADKTYQVVAPDAADLTLLARGLEVDAPTQEWFGSYRLVGVPQFTVRSELVPAIGVGPGAPAPMRRFLAQEGFVVEEDDRPSRYGLYFDRWERFREEDQRTIIQLIEDSTAPLVRIWRWPGRARCALSLTGDVDAMTLLDFFRRPLEV